MRIIESILLLLFLISNEIGQAQSYVKISQDTTINFTEEKANKYVDSRMAKLNKFNNQNERRVRRFLNKLSKKEKRLLSKIKKQDTVLYAKLKNEIGFDSLKTQAQLKSNVLSCAKGSFNSTIDSLKRISSFAQSTLNQGDNLISKVGVNSTQLDELNSLQSKLDYNQGLNNQIQNISSKYKEIGNNYKNLGSLKGIQKQSFYYQQQLKAYKNIANDPSILEEKALSYLQGMEGFDQKMSNPISSFSGNSSAQSMPHNASVEELEKRGFQTKRSVNKQLNSQFGIGNSTDKINELNAQVKDQVKEFKKLKQDINSTKNSINSIEKPSFRINPMRGLPLKLRLEKSLNWQVLQASSTNPVILELNMQLGFKHTPRLTYNIVAGSSAGLGKDWRNIRFSFEGLRIGVNTDLKWIWGISGQVGYERIYKQYSETKIIPANEGLPQQLITTTKNYRDIAYCGIQKTYKINSKYSGTMLLAYDFLWKQGNARTPIIWRFGWKK